MHQEKHSTSAIMLTAIGWLIIIGPIACLSLFVAFRIIAQKTDEQLIELLRSKNESVRLSAAIDLASRKNPAAFEALVNLLQSDAPISKRRAAEALGDLGDRRATRFLCALLNDRESYVRSDAAEALAQLGDQGAVEPLLQALTNKSLSDRWVVADAFATFHDERAIPALIDLLNTEEVSIMSSAQAALMSQGTKAILPLIDAMLTRGEPLQGNAGFILARIEEASGKIAPLHDAMANKDLKKLSRAYSFFLCLDKTLSKSEQELLASTLSVYGDTNMAQCFRNYRANDLFASSILPDAAHSWAKQNGYTFRVKRR